MRVHVAADDQAIASRFGESVWLTEFVTPDNPDVLLKFQELTQSISDSWDRVMSCWKYVSRIPYRKTVRARMVVEGNGVGQQDTWLYPNETIRLAPVANCANKSFLLASLLLNELPHGRVRVVMGHIVFEDINAHAWVEVNPDGVWYLLETTIKDANQAIMKVAQAEVYEAMLWFDDKEIKTIEALDTNRLLEESFGFCAVPFLQDYVCGRCSDLRR